MQATIYRAAANLAWSCRRSAAHHPATASVHDTFHTTQGHYARPLYRDEWTLAVDAACQRLRKTVENRTANGLLTVAGIGPLKQAWDARAAQLDAAVLDAGNHWQDVLADARARQNGMFDPALYPAIPYTVHASLSLTSTAWPAELDQTEAAGLRVAAEASLRDELLDAQSQHIQEVLELVERQAESKRPEKTRKAGIARLHTLRRLNLLNDPAYTARIDAALVSLGAAATTVDVTFGNPFGE